MGGNGVAAYIGEIMYATDVNKMFIYTGSKWEELETAYEKHEPEQPREIKAMICTQCGAPINKDNYCEYCDTRYR